MKKFLLFFFLIFSSLCIFSEEYWNYKPYTTEGTEFYVTFMKNGGAETGAQALKFFLYASTRSQDATITVYDAKTETKITEFNCTNIEVGRTNDGAINNENAFLENSNIIYDRVLKVTSNTNISLYASNYNNQSYGAFNVLPIEALSNEYVIQTYGSDVEATQFAIIATQDNTTIHITPSDTIKWENGSFSITPQIIKLDKGQAYQIHANQPHDNLSGTVICSDKPIAIFNGGQTAQITNDASSQDHVVEQSLPTYMWGKEFIVTNSITQDFNIVKITAMYDNTRIRISNKIDTILNKTETYTFAQYRSGIDLDDIYLVDTTVNNYIIADAAYIETSYPSICFLYHSSSDFDISPKEYEKYGDASMVFVPPLEQYLNDISFLTYNINNKKTYHFVNIVTKNINSVYLDGVKINSSEFINVPNSNYYYARLEINEGSHKITSGGDGFIAYVYGIGDRIAYGYNVGNNLLPLSSYMLIEGKRVNQKSFCLNDVIDIEGIINYEYSKVEWYMDSDNEPDSVIYSGQTPIIQYQYDTTGTYNIKMVVTKKNPLCSGISDCTECGNTQDTVKATIRIFDTYNVSLTEYICDGESYNWQLYEIDTISKAKKLVKDTVITTGGMFREKLQSIKGCDSIITLTTVIVPKPHVSLDSSICECETPYKFNKKLLYESGTYYDTLKTIHGCDSFITLNLTVNPCYDMPIEEGVVCGNEEFEWRNKVFKNLKVDSTYLFYDSLKTEKYNCDSVYTLELYVAPTYYFDDDTIRMCDSEVRSWEGHKNDTVFQDIKAGVYMIYDSLKTKEYGCDSIHKLTLIVYSTEKKIEEHIMCQNEIYEWRGKKYSGLELDLGSHIFCDTIKTEFGCQNIYELNLTINSIDIIDEGRDSICQNKSYSWRGKVYENLKVDTTYILYDSLKTYLGCDSIYKIELYVASTYNLYDTASICDGEPFIWEVTGRTYTQAGDYDTTFTSILGCDSIWHLHLKVGKKYFIEESVKICDNEYYIWEGHKNNIVYENLKADTTYIFYDSLKTNTFGCDSIHKLTIEVCPTFLKDEGRDFICQNKSYSWRGKVYENFKVDTTYILYDSLKTHLGCDSIYKIELYVAPTYNLYDTASICDGEPFTWEVTGKTYTQAGDYDTTFTSILGCDSIWHLHLKVGKKYFIEDSVKICDNEYYIWEGHKNNIVYENLKGDTTYIFYDSLKTNTFGCDSIHKLTIEVCPTFLKDEGRDSICQNKSYSWRGKVYENLKGDTTYIFYDSLKTHLGCDSIYKFELYVAPTYNLYDTASICDGEPFIWEVTDRTYTQAGDYDTTFTSILGCDSIWHLHLKVGKKYFIEDSVKICDNECYIWKGHKNDTILQNIKAGEYTIIDSLKTIGYGCDSIHQLVVNVYPTYFTYEGNDSICLTELKNYKWKNHENKTFNFDFSKGDTTYILYDSLKTHLGCDSIYKFELYVAPIFHKDTIVSICEKDSFYWDVTKEFYSEVGVYNYSAISALGCDSTFTLNLMVNPIYEKDTTIRFCDCNLPFDYPGDFFENDIFVKAGVYSDTLQTIHGCDSILNLTLIIDSCYLDITKATICGNEKFEFRGKFYRRTGIYDDTLKTIHNCDSIFRLDLFVQPSYEFPETRILCDNKNFVWQGDVIDKQYLLDHYTQLYDTTTLKRCLPTYAGCDSCWTLNVILCPTYFFTDTITLCSNESYKWNDRLNDTIFNNLAPGKHIFYDSLSTVRGCDSVYQLVVNVDPAYLFVKYDTICDNDFYIWEDRKNDTIIQKLVAGSYIFYDSLKTNLGCDSVYQLNLIVNATYFEEMNVSICDDGFYIFNGDTLNQSGVYSDSLLSVCNCDSVFYLNLTVNPTSDTIIYDTICCGDYYKSDSIGKYVPFEDVKITKAGYYKDTIENEYGCNYYVELYLSEIEPTKMDATILDVCADDEYIFIPYTYEGRKPIAYSVKFTEEGHLQGFQDVDHKEINIEGGDSVLYIPMPYNIDRQIYPRPDYYDATIFLHNGICSDSLIMEKETFLVKYPSWITEQHWNDVISLLNDRYNGGYTFSRYQWYHNGVAIPGEDSSYIYTPLIMGDEYYAEVTRTDDGKTFETCPIYPEIVTDSVIPYPYAEIIPSVISISNPHAEIKSLEEGICSIYSCYGRYIAEYNFTPPSTEIKLPIVSGVYIVIFKTVQNNRRHIQRIVIH